MNITSKMSTWHKVFVYGTLKRNEPNYNWLVDKNNGKAKFLGLARTVERFPLVIASRYNIPYLLALQGTGKNVEGEVYEVDDDMLGKLDILEDHPNYYERKVHQVKLVESNEKVDVWLYLLHKFRPRMLELPFLESYENEGDHGLKYVERYLRANPRSEHWNDVKQIQ